MATMLHSESRRMYSWWWDSHISPKNSKWLQENLTDMDRNVKAMIKLIEEDADSFARRAEMYYKKRPELMKLVEEFYRTYRALAERYDHATGALRQAHRTMSEAFPNQIPLIMHDESPSSSSSEFGPRTPEMPSPLQVALDSDDLHTDASGASPHFNIRRKFGLFSEENDLLSSKRGLKQLKELFPTGEAVSGQVRKGLNFREEERKTEEKEDFKNEIKRLQDEVSDLSSRNENLMNQMATESERARNLEEFIFKLESEKGAALLQYNVSTERLSTLETDIFNTRDELNKVSNEMLMKLTNVEEQCLTMEKMNQSLQFELQNQHAELEKKGRELEELNISIEEEHQKRMQAETALMSFEQMRTHSQEEAKLLILEILSGTEKLKQMELSKAGLEEKIFELNGVIASLREQNISYDVKIMDLQDEIKSLKETKKKLEDGLGLYFEENKNLQQELCSLKDDQINLERSHLGLTEQMEVVSEKNELLENSLSDARFELESLRDKAGALEASCEALLGEVSTHVVEKDVIVSKIEDVSKNMVSLLEKNALLENSLSDANAELDGLRARYQDLDESCVSLCEKNYSLLIDKNTLVSQLENLENKYLGLQNQLFNLEREKDLTVVRVLDLESLLRLERQEHDALIMSLSTQLASVHKQINLLQEEIQVKEKNLEAEQQKCINSLFEIFILRRCLSEMRDNNLLLSGECQNLLEASKCTEDKISQLELEKLFQKDELKLVSAHNEILREGIHLLSEELSIDVKHESMDSTTVELLLQTIQREVKSIQSAISDTRDENQQLHIKVAKFESKHLKLQGEYLSLMMEKDSLVHEVTGLENSLRLEKQEHEALLLSCSSQLTSSQNQIRNLEDEIHIREEEFEVDQQKTMSAHLENLILQTCLCDMKEKNLILSGECWSLLEALRYAEKQICQLEDMELTHKKELSLLSNHNDTVRARIHLLSEELNIDVKYGFKEDATDEALFQAISDEIKHILSSVSDAHDENQRLNLEVPVLVTLIEQIGLDRFHLICELESRSEGLLALESKTSKLRERNEQLSSEKNIVISQVADLESKHLKLQDRHSSLMTEKNTLVHEVKGLESFLKLEKQEHEALLLSFSSKLVSSQNLIRHLEEEIHIREGDFEVEQLKTMAAHLENIVLQRCLYDMKDKNLIISGECWSLLETLRSAEKRICQLEDRELTQTEELSVLLNHNNTIRARIHLLLEALNIDIKHGTKEDAMDEVLLQAILHEIRNMLSSVSDAHDENHRLHLEILVLATVFKQIGLDRYHLICELESRSEELLASKSKTIKLAEINEQLSSEKSILVSQVEIFGQRLKSLETEYSELEHKHTKLEEEKDSVFHQAMELENSLKTDKQESQALILSCKDRIASLESQLSLMQEERRFMVAKFETVQEKLMSALLEIFILQRCLNDMKDANLILSEECRKLLESYRHSLDIISELEQKQNVQEKDMLLLLNNNDKLRDGVLLLLEELNINVDSEIVGGTKCEELLQTISGEIKALMNSFVNTEEENNCLHLEISVLATLILCTGVDKANLNHELKDRMEEVLFLEKEKDDAVEINKQLKLELHILGEQLSESHEVQQRLQTELCNLVEGNLSWSERFAKLKEEKDALEEENISVLADALTLDHLLIFFKSLCSEEISNLILLSDDISCLLAVKSNVDEEIRVKNGIIEELEIETVKLKELSVIQGIDINEARNFCEEVCLQVEAGEILLLQKEMEIAELREENADLCRNYERVNKDLDSADQVRNKLEKKIQILTLGSVSKDGKITDIMEANRLLRKEQDMLNSELEVLRRREQSLTSELQKGIIDVNKSEGEIETLLNDIHISIINAAVLEEKLFELIIACESLEIFAFLQRDRFSEEIVFKSAFIDELKNKLDDLGVENSTLKANLNAYSSLLLSLFDRIATIEEHIVSLAKLPKRKDDETLGNLKNKKSSHQPSEDNITTVKPELFVSQKLIPKVEALQQVVIDTKNLLEQERLDSNAKLEAARKEIEELKLKEVFLKEISREKYGQTMKDIQLDQVSSSCINPYRLNRIKNSESDDQMLELWETAERDEVEEVKSEYPSSELVAEKELSIDKLEISTRINESPREWAKRFFEKLNYDAKRLSLVRRGLLELKAKLGSLEKRWRPKNPEYSTFKLQLIDFEVALSEQVDFNGKLKKKVEDILGSSDSVIRMEERKQISEEARLGSENVGKLELELQKSEYIFLKVEEEEEKRKIGCVERTSGVLLRDYIYGRRAGKGRWKRPFCGCTRPKTNS